VSKIGESSWSFRFTFRDGDYQSMSEEYIIQYEGVSLVIVDTPTEEALKLGVVDKIV
jgi:hypothetical protein